MHAHTRAHIHIHTHTHTHTHREEGDEEEEDEGDLASGDELEGVLAREREGRGNRPMDDAFDMLLEEYDSEEDIGELDPEDPRLMGGVEDAVEEYSAEITEFETRMERNYGQPKTAMTARDIELAKLAAEGQGGRLQDEDDDDVTKLNAGIDAMFKTKPKDNWDVESIVSTYTNTENHPNMIKIPRKDRTKIRLGKEGVAVDYMPQRKFAEPIPEETEGDEVVDEGARRERGETKEDKKARKEAVKEAQRAARDRKRNLKGQYADEMSKQIKDDHRQRIFNSSHLKL
jgi:protein LTV1